MKFHALFLMFLTLSCSDQHSHIYIHNKQIYATSEVSEFDVDHYSQRANSNFLILNDSESKLSKLTTISLGASILYFLPQQKLLLNTRELYS